MIAKLHFTKDAFSLHLFLQRFQRLVHIVIAYNNLQLSVPVLVSVRKQSRGQKAKPGLESITPAKTRQALRCRSNSQTFRKCLASSRIFSEIANLLVILKG